MSNRAETPDEAPIKVCEPKEPLQVFDRLGCGPFSDSGHFGLVHQDSLWTNDVGKKLNGLLIKFTFFSLTNRCCYARHQRTWWIWSTWVSREGESGCHLYMFIFIYICYIYIFSQRIHQDNIDENL